MSNLAGCPGVGNTGRFAGCVANKFRLAQCVQSCCPIQWQTGTQIRVTSSGLIGQQCCGSDIYANIGPHFSRTFTTTINRLPTGCAVLHQIDTARFQFPAACAPPNCSGPCSFQNCLVTYRFALSITPLDIAIGLSADVVRCFEPVGLGTLVAFYYRRLCADGVALPNDTYPNQGTGCPIIPPTGTACTGGFVTIETL